MAAAAAAGGYGGGHEQSSSSSHSSSSGTVVSTAYTSSSASRLSPASMEAALHLGMGIHDDDELVSCWEETEERELNHIKSLVREFFGAQSANCSTNGGDMSVLARWLTDLGVGWVLRLASGASAGELLDHMSDAGRWIGALEEIVRMLGSICEEEEEEEVEAESSIPDQFLFARFFQETMARMLAFVDAIVALHPNGVPALHRKINILLPVCAALSDASTQIEEFISTPSAQVERILSDMVNLLSVKQGETCEAIWSALEETSSRILKSMEDAQTTHGSSGVHRVTLSVMDHINFLLGNYSPLNPIVTKAASLGKYVSHIGDLPYLDSRIMEMVSCLEVKLVNMSESFSDQGLKFIFLLNNSDLIRQVLQNNTRHSSLHAYVAALSAKVEGYMESYLQVSWAPLLTCLFNPLPFCLFGKYYYPQTLPKFESEFQKVYTTQKLWKVPDPDLRTSLRMAITEKIIPVYTKYLEDNNTTTPRIASQELEEMLQEIFEG